MFWILRAGQSLIHFPCSGSSVQSVPLAEIAFHQEFNSPFYCANFPVPSQTFRLNCTPDRDTRLFRISAVSVWEEQTGSQISFPYQRILFQNFRNLSWNSYWFLVEITRLLFKEFCILCSELLALFSLQYSLKMKKSNNTTILW